MEFFCSIFTRCRERRAYSPEVGTHGASLDADWQDFDEINHFLSFFRELCLASLGRAAHFGAFVATPPSYAGSTRIAKLLRGRDGLGVFLVVVAVGFVGVGTRFGDEISGIRKMHKKNIPKDTKNTYRQT